MRTKTANLILFLAAMFLLGIVADGQGAPANAERIRQLRNEIQKRQAADVPADLVELNRSKLIERCAELRTLLKIEIDNLRKHKSFLGTDITAEESQKTDESIQNYTAEITHLGSIIQSEIAADNTPPASPDSGQPATSPTQPAGNPVDGASATPGAATPRRAVSGNGTGAGGTNSGSNPANPQGPSPNIKPALSDDESSKPPDPALDCDKVNRGQQSASELDKITCGLVRDIPARRVTPGSKNRISLRPQLFDLILIMIAKKDTPALLVEAEDVRLDQQVGGAPSNAGGSLVVKGGVPAFLGFAVENGGLTQTVNGSAITFRGNPVGLINAFANKGFVTSAKQDERDPTLRFLKKTSFAFTFNTDRGSQPGVFTGKKEQLSSFSTRLELINKRKAELYIKDWEDFLKNRAQPLADLINKDAGQFIDTEFTDESVFPYGKWKDPALQLWFDETQRAIEDASDAKLSAVLQDRLNKLPVKELRPDTVLLLNGLEKQMGVYMSGRDEVLNKINSGTLVTFEYLNKREVNAPDTSNFRFIAEKGIENGKVDFTLNASLTMFNNLSALRKFVAMNPTLPTPRRVRDFQFAGQIDIPVGSVRELGQFAFFAAGRYERLLENASTDFGMILPNTKGDIGYLQLGIKVPIKGTGFKIPFSITFANRTELINEREVRGNFGFTLDLDTLFAKFKPF